MSRRFESAARQRRIGALLAVAILAVSSCSAGRPTVEEWQPTWDRISGTLPSESSLGEDPPLSVCSATLAFLRSNRAELFPTPDPAIDDTVTAWIQIAEDAFFECPPNNPQSHSFAEAYEEMRRLQGEIEAVLELDRGT